ncbi:MAG: hypothetical protein WBB28_04340 [Crinalium sp.]
MIDEFKRRWQALIMMLPGLCFKILLIFCVVFLFGIGEVAELKCQRLPLNRGICQIVNSGLWWSNKKEIPLSKLQGAKLQEDISRDDKGKTSRNYSVILLTQDGDMKLASIWSSNNKQASEQDVARINEFASNLTSSLNIKQDHRFLPYLMGIIVLFVFLKF